MHVVVMQIQWIHVVKWHQFKKVNSQHRMSEGFSGNKLWPWGIIFKFYYKWEIRRFRNRFNATTWIWSILVTIWAHNWSGSVFIKPNQLDPWIKDQLGNVLLSTILPLQLPIFVSCGRACPSHVTQNGEIVDRRMIYIWFLIHGSGWSGLIKAEHVFYIPVSFILHYHVQ